MVLLWVFTKRLAYINALHCDSQDDSHDLLRSRGDGEIYPKALIRYSQNTVVVAYARRSSKVRMGYCSW